jgi:cytochrome P450
MFGDGTADPLQVASPRPSTRVQHLTESILSDGAYTRDRSGHPVPDTVMAKGCTDVDDGHVPAYTSAAPSTVMPLPGPTGRKRLRLMRQLFNQPHDALDELRSDYGPICELGVWPMRLAVLGDPRVLHEMFTKRPDSFRWNHKLHVIGVKFVVGSDSMIVSDGEDHRRRRGSVQAAFTRARLNRWIPMIVQRTDVAIDTVIDEVIGAGPSVGPGAQVDLYPDARRLVLGVVVHAMFGEHLAARSDTIGELLYRAQAYIEAPAVKQLPHPLPRSARARARDDVRELRQILRDEIHRRRTTPSGDPLDVLEAMVQQGTLSDDEIVDQAISLIGAGFDTTSAMLAWTLRCAASVPDMLRRLRAEADRVLGSSGQPLDELDDVVLTRLDLAGRVVRESLRLHPAGAGGVRQAAIDMTLGGFRVRKGTYIFWSAHLAGRDPDVWTDPLTFDPERFVDISPDQKAMSDQAWVPFGRGPHSCIGFALAQMELTLMTARIAQRLDLEPVSTAPLEPIGMIVSRPVGGAPFYVRPRPA